MVDVGAQPANLRAMKSTRILLFALVVLTALALSAIASAQSTFDDLAESNRLFAQANAKWGDGKSAEAEAMLERSIEIRRRVLGPADPSVAFALDQLGKISYNRAEFRIADARFREALAIMEKASGAPDVNVALVLGDLAAALRGEGRYVEAEEIVRRSLSLRRSLLPPSDPKIAAGLNNLGRLLIAEGRYSDAEGALDESLQLYRATLGPDHQLVKQGQELLDSLHATIERQRNFLVTIAEWGVVLMLSLSALIACIIWSEGRTKAGIVPPVPTFVTGIAAFARLGFIAASAFLGAAGSTWLLVDFDPTLLSEGSVRQNIGRIGGLLTVFLATVVMQLFANAARRAFGLPGKPVVLFAASKRTPTNAVEQRGISAGRPVGGTVSVSRALMIGHLWVNLPVVLIWIVGWSAFAIAIIQMQIRLHFASTWAIILLPIGLALATAPAWLWWSIAIPKWRRWALVNVCDWPALKRRAVASGLIWRDGSVFGRTEIKSAAEQRWETAYERYLLGMEDCPAPLPVAHE